MSEGLYIYAKEPFAFELKISKLFRASLTVWKDVYAADDHILRDLGYPHQTVPCRHLNYLLMVSPVPQTGNLFTSVLDDYQLSNCASESTPMLESFSKTFLLSH